MPIYEYECQSCRHRLEKLQRISDEPLTDCPECGATALKRLISAAGFRLKGSGWYETDFKQDKRRNVAGDAEGAGSGSGSGGGESGGGKSGGGESGQSKSANGEGGKSAAADKKGAAKSTSEQAA